jgi:hypothetical protein
MSEPKQKKLDQYLRFLNREVDTTAKVLELVWEADTQSSDKADVFNTFEKLLSGIEGMMSALVEY